MTTTHDKEYVQDASPAERDFAQDAYAGLSAGHIMEALTNDLNRLQKQNTVLRQLLEQAGIDPSDYFEDNEPKASN